MRLILSALRRPLTVIVIIVAIALSRCLNRAGEGARAVQVLFEEHVAKENGLVLPLLAMAAVVGAGFATTGHFMSGVRRVERGLRVAAGLVLITLDMPEDYVRRAKELGQPAIAITDHGNLYGALEFYQTCRANDLNTILGYEAYMEPGHRTDRSASRLQEAAFHLTLLAMNQTGFKNLIKMASKAYLEGFYYKPRIDKELLARHARGLIGLSSCLKGEVAEGLTHGQERKAIAAAAAYRDILGPGNFFLEMQWHGIDEQRTVNGSLPAMARDLGLPLVCTNDVHYLRESDAHPHDVLLCIGTGKAFSDPKRLRYEARQFFLKSADEMAETFKDHPEALRNTVRIAERCNVMLPDGENFLPDFEVPG